MSHHSRVYAGLGFDVPTQHVRVSPQQVRDPVRAALAAGADGIVLPREWHEARRENLKAAGESVAEFSR